MAITECCISSGLAANIKLPDSESRLDRILFAEGGPRILISCSKKEVLNLKNYYNEFIIDDLNSFSLTHLGNVENDQQMKFYKNNNLIINVNISELKDVYKNAISNIISK